MLAFLPFAILTVVLDALITAEARSTLVNLQQGGLPLRPLERRDAGIEQAAISSDSSSYYTLISVGNINFRVALDTASADLWILSSACGSNECRSLPNYPLTYHSPSFGIINGNNTLFNISFADTTAASGYLASELVQLENFTLPNQVFGLANSSNVTLKSEVSGILGLGFPRLSQFAGLASNGTPFMSRLAQQGLLDYPMFGLSLTRNDTGTLSLGAVDTDVVQNVTDIEWHRVMPFSSFRSESNTSRYLQWAIELNAIGVNGTTIAPQPTYPTINDRSLALLDVGANGMFGPYQDVSRLFEQIEGARLVDETVGQWAIPCNTDQVMSFSFGRHNFTLQPTDFIIGSSAEQFGLCLAWPRAAVDVGDGIDWQLGTPFLRTVYSVFSYGINDKEPPMIGLYSLQNLTTLNETASQISSFLASASPTIATNLPNSLLPTPSPTPVPYLFNTSIPASIGQIVSSELGTSTYSALLNGPSINGSAIPTITASPTLATLIVTDGTNVFTTTSRAAQSSVVLGRPPGFSGAPPRVGASFAGILGPTFAAIALFASSVVFAL